ncbi:MAG: hypothetical protein ACSHWU_04695 [Marinicella sp.]
MKTLLFLMSFSGLVLGETRTYDFNQGSTFQINQVETTYTLESFPDFDLLTSFLGPCDQDECNVLPDTSFDLTYTVTGSDACTGLNGTVDWQTAHPAVDGEHSIPISSITEDTVFTLSCSDSISGQTNTRSVQINLDNSPQCSADIYPPNLTRLSSTYQFFNDGYDFGETTHTDVLINLATSEFITLSDFGLTELNFRRRIDFVSAPTNYNRISQATVSISECPGDFTETSICNYLVENFRSIRFSTNQADNPLLYCILEPGTNYYINFVLSPSPYTEPPSCDSENDFECAIFYTETSQ